MSPSSSVAVIAVPIFCPVAVFSATERVAVAPSVNTGELLDCVSVTSVTLIVTGTLSVNVPSDAVIVTEYEFFAS